jgi:hypothetical protein
MAQLPKKRQGKKAAPAAQLLGKRLVLDRSVALGGGLAAQLCEGSAEKDFYVYITLRTKGAGGLRLFSPYWRETRALAAKSAEELLIRLASALRQAGAS